MLKDIAREYFIDRNYNCAESVLRAANDFYGLELHDRDMILIGGYGGGIQCGSTCGALLGGVAALSMMFIKTKAHESEDIKEVVNLFLDKLKAALESTLCSDIKPRALQGPRSGATRLSGSPASVLRALLRSSEGPVDDGHIDKLVYRV